MLCDGIEPDELGQHDHASRLSRVVYPPESSLACSYIVVAASY